MTDKLIIVRNDIQKLSTVRNDDEKTILCPQRQVKKTILKEMKSNGSFLNFWNAIKDHSDILFFFTVRKDEMKTIHKMYILVSLHTLKICLKSHDSKGRIIRIAEKALF